MWSPVCIVSLFSYARVLHFMSASSVLLEYRTYMAAEVQWTTYTYHLHHKMQYSLRRPGQGVYICLIWYKLQQFPSAPQAIPRELAVVVCSHANVLQSYSIICLCVTDKPTQYSFSASTRPSSAFCLSPSTWDGWETLSHCGHHTNGNSLEPSMDSYVGSIIIPNLPTVLMLPA